MTTKLTLVNNWDNTACVIQCDDGNQHDLTQPSIEVPISSVPVLIDKLHKFQLYHDKLKALDK